jgi:hypothetical protein
MLFFHTHFIIFIFFLTYLLASKSKDPLFIQGTCFARQLLAWIVFVYAAAAAF